MRKFYCLVFLLVNLSGLAQTDTLKLNGTWGKLRFDSTTILQSRTIIGLPKDSSNNQTMSTHWDTISHQLMVTRSFCYTESIDSLHTTFFFCSNDTNMKSHRTFERMEFYGYCKVKMNGSLKIDKSTKADIKKTFGKPSETVNDPNFELTFQKYRLYVNNAWCDVEFYYDVNGTLRKVFIQQIGR